MTGFSVDVTGDTSVSTFDSTGATSLATGGGTVNIASTGVMTTIKGTLNVDEAVTLEGNLTTSNTTAKIPVTKSTFAIKNDSTTLVTDISDVSNTWITPSGYSQNINLISSNSAVKMEFKVNFRASPEADQLISFRVYRNNDLDIVFQDCSLGSTMGVTLTNVYNGTFIDTTPGGINPTYTLQYYLHCPDGNTITTPFGILGDSNNCNYILLQELYEPEPSIVNNLYTDYGKPGFFFIEVEMLLAEAQTITSIAFNYEPTIFYNVDSVQQHFDSSKPDEVIFKLVEKNNVANNYNDIVGFGIITST